MHTGGERRIFMQIFILLGDPINALEVYRNRQGRRKPRLPAFLR
jgi:hypothetical protein